MFILDLDPVDWPWAILSRTSRSTGVDTTDFVMTRTFSRPTNTTRYGNISLKHINMNNVNFRYICLTLHNYTEYMVNVFKYRTVGLMMFNSKKTRYTCRMKLGKPFNLSPNISYIWRLLICIIFFSFNTDLDQITEPTRRWVWGWVQTVSRSWPTSGGKPPLSPPRSGPGPT